MPLAVAGDPPKTSICLYPVQQVFVFCTALLTSMRGSVVEGLVSVTLI